MFNEILTCTSTYLEPIEIMAYALYPPPTARHFDLNGAKFMHSSIQRMCIRNPNSYSTTVGTGQLPNPKYQRYYDAERDYYVPYNSGDTSDVKEQSESEGEISNLTYKIYGSDNPDYEPSDGPSSDSSENHSKDLSDNPSESPSVDPSESPSDKPSESLSDTSGGASDNRPKSQASSRDGDVPSDSSACNCNLCEDAYEEMKKREKAYQLSKNNCKSNNTDNVIDLVDSDDDSYDDAVDGSAIDEDVAVSDK